MTHDQCIEKAKDILPEKILRQHVNEDDVALIYDVIGAAIFSQTNGVCPVLFMLRK